MLTKLNALGVLLLGLLLAVPTVWAGAPGTTNLVFNKKFLSKVQPMMPYDQLVRIVGSEGLKSGEDRAARPPAVMYHWNGGRRSALDVKVSGGKVVDGAVTTPKGKKRQIGSRDWW